MNFWVHSTDWHNQATHHIISNGQRGGWSLEYDNGYNTTHFFAVDNAGHILEVNEDGKVCRDLSLPGASAPTKVVQTPEMYTWILDQGLWKGSKHIYKIDYNGNVDRIVVIDASKVPLDIAISKEDELLVNFSDGVVKYNADGTLVGSVSTVGSLGNTLVLKSDGSVSCVDAVNSCVHRGGFIWHTPDNISLYATDETGVAVLKSSDTIIQDIKSTENYVWVLCHDRLQRWVSFISPQTGYTDFKIDLEYPLSTTDQTHKRGIIVTNEFTTTNADYVWIVDPDESKMVKYDVDMNVIDTVMYDVFPNQLLTDVIHGDQSGYQWYETFNAYTDGERTEKIRFNVHLKGSSDAVAKKYSCTIPTTQFPANEWHMFTAGINTSAGVLDLSLDTVLRDSVSIPSKPIFLKYETPMLFGVSTGHVQAFPEELDGLSRRYHNGSIDALRIYKTQLDKDSRWRLCMLKYHFGDMIWNMNIDIHSYVEEIVKFFKFKMPGQKSQFFNIKISGHSISDPALRLVIEGVINDTIQKISPLYTYLYKIIWE